MKNFIKIAVENIQKRERVSSPDEMEEKLSTLENISIKQKKLTKIKNNFIKSDPDKYIKFTPGKFSLFFNGV